MRAFRAGLAALHADDAEILLPFARDWAEKSPRDPRLQQLLGLAARSAGDSATAWKAFAEAAALAPGDPLIAHSRARTALEAGHLSVDLFDRAAVLAPRDGSVLLGKAAALLQDHGPEEATSFLCELIRSNPGWIDGQRSLAHLLGQMGECPVSEIDRALGRFPDNEELSRLKIGILLEARLHERAAAACEMSLGRLGQRRWLVLLAAHTASELGRLEEADTLFTQCGNPQNVEEVGTVARHLLRAQRPVEACSSVEPWIAEDCDNLLWPYLSLAWRITGDDRWRWLEGDERLVGTYDLTGTHGDLSAIADHVRDLHFAKAPPLDQSVRGGTQTDGNLLLRDEPPIVALRAAIREAVAAHIEALPEPDDLHPTLLRDRHPQRIAGSWSVRLTGAGFHADHVHSQGWFSSAFYLTVPEAPPGDAGSQNTAGWLSLGECRELVTDLAPSRMIEPKPGLLVLFPSTMWHGTRAFPSGERMTVAFDIARPSQKNR